MDNGNGRIVCWAVLGRLLSNQFTPLHLLGQDYPHLHPFLPNNDVWQQAVNPRKQLSYNNPRLQLSALKKGVDSMTAEFLTEREPRSLQWAADCWVLSAIANVLHMEYYPIVLALKKLIVQDMAATVALVIIWRPYLYKGFTEGEFKRECFHSYKLF